MFKLSFSNTVLRFYLMMLVGILAVYTSQFWLVYLAFAIAVSAILGYRIEWGTSKAESKVVKIGATSEEMKRKAS